MADESFKIECPYCTQHIRAYPEHVGFEIDCPTCGERYTIPNPLGDEESFATLPAPEPPESSFLSQEDFYALAGEAQETVDRISNLDPGLWWECAAMGELLLDRLQPLKDSVNIQREEFFHPGTHDQHIAYLNHLEQRTSEFIDIINFLSRALTSDLQRAVVRPGLKTIVSAANRVGRELSRVRDFHELLYEHSLPQEQPFPEVHRILAGWGPFVCNQIDICVDQLFDKSNGTTGDWGEARLMVSIIPPDLTNYFYLKKQLQAKYGR